MTTLADIRSAAAVLRGVAHETPVLRSRLLDELTGARLFFKCENLQRAGAFKFRGAYHAVSRLSNESRSRGVLTWSSGNHAQALALACRLQGAPCTVVMPEDAPPVKLAATRDYGATIIPYDPRTARREELGLSLARERGLSVIPPYDHADVIAGQGTVGLELMDSLPDLDVLLVPCGGGGLLSGCAVATRALSPRCRVIGVEPGQADDATRSFRDGVLRQNHNPPTIADGARTPSLGRLTFPLVRSLVHDMVTVSEHDIARGMFLLWERMKLVVEPTGALALAAALAGAAPVAGMRAGVVISGGNVDLERLAVYRQLLVV
jgi:threo-3-hydroxy-L-aspartate ammonia-lyase